MKTTAKSVMTVMGKIIVQESNKHILESGMVKLSVLDYLAIVLPLGTKTIQRRLLDDGWTYKELLALQLHFKSDHIQNYINSQFTQAINS